MLAQGVPPPFVLSVSFPFKSLPLCSVGKDMIISHGVQNSLVMVQPATYTEDDDLDKFLDLVEITNNVSIIILWKYSEPCILFYMHICSQRVSYCF